MECYYTGMWTKRVRWASEKSLTKRKNRTGGKTFRNTTIDKDNEGIHFINSSWYETIWNKSRQKLAKRKEETQEGDLDEQKLFPYIPC